MQKIEIPEHLLIKNSNLPLIEKLLKMANYFGEPELYHHIANYINMQKTYKKIACDLSQAGFKIPETSAIVSFFKNKILEIYFNEYFQKDFIDWLN